MSSPAPFVLAAAGSIPDPSSVAQHLDICRLHAELEGLEARIAELDSTAAMDGEVAAPFAERTEELVERMVSSLLQSGRDEISVESDRRTREARARLDEAARRANGIVDRARSEVTAALAERERRLLAVRPSGLDVVVLADEEVRAAVAALRPAPAAAIPSPVPVIPPQDAGHAVTVAPAVSEPVEAEAPPATAVEVEEARTDAAFDVWMAVAPVTGDVEAVVTPVEVEHVAGADTVGANTVLTRSRWVLPVEVIGALLAAAILVVALLVVIG